jgi:hypothetical protein
MKMEWWKSYLSRLSLDAHDYSKNVNTVNKKGKYRQSFWQKKIDIVIFVNITYCIILAKKRQIFGQNKNIWSL